MAEGPFEALALAGAEAVLRHAEALHLQELGHRLDPSVRRSSAAVAVDGDRSQVRSRAGGGGARPTRGVARLRLGERVPVPGDGSAGEARFEAGQRGVQPDDGAAARWRRRGRSRSGVSRRMHPASTGSSSHRREEPGSTWVCSRSIGGSTRRIVHVRVTGSSPVPVNTIWPPSRRSTVMSASKGSHQSASRSGVVMASQTSRSGWARWRSKRMTPPSAVRSSVPSGEACGAVGHAELLRASAGGVRRCPCRCRSSASSRPASSRPVGLEPGVELAQRFRSQAVEAALRVPADLDEAGVAEHLEVAGHAGLVHADLLDQLGHRPLPHPHRIEDPPPGGLGDHVEHGQVGRAST